MLAEIQTGALVGFAVAGAVSDLRTRRIPNWLTVTGMVLALVLRFAAGWAPLADGLLGAGLGLLIGIPLFALGALGGGDAKFIAALGAFMAPDRLVGSLLLGAILGGLIAVADAARRGILLPVLYNTVGVMKRLATLGFRGEARSLETPGALSIPYGVPIGIGAIIWWFAGVPVL